MTVAELIAKLQRLPLEMRVTVDGPEETGVTERIVLRVERVFLDVHKERYNGEHEPCSWQTQLTDQGFDEADVLYISPED